MKACRKIQEWIDLYLDDEPLTSAKREQILAHMRDCARCQQYFAKGERLRGLLRSTPTATLPSDFRRHLMARIQAEERESEGNATTPRWAFVRGRPRWAMAFGTTALLVIALLWGLLGNKPPEVPVIDAPQTVQSLQIDVVSPFENAVVEPNQIDIAAAFYSLEEETVEQAFQVRLLLDAKDVTEVTEITQDYLIYTPDHLEPGPHLVTVQILDVNGTPTVQRSWAFYVLSPSL